MSDVKHRRQLATRTKLVFVAIVVVLVISVVEVMCWAALSVLHGRPVGWKSLHAYRSAVARETDRDATLRTETDAAEQIPPWAAGVREDYILHPYLGFVANPPADLAQRGPRYRPEAGNFGFPYNFHEIFNEQSEDILVVAVVGGSVAQQIGGQGRPFQYLDTELEASSRFIGKDVRVVNLAMGGYKQPQQLMVLTYFMALGAHFDIVVNLDGFNEVTLPVRDNFEVGVNPFYPRAWRYRLGRDSTDELNARAAVVVIDDLRQSLARRAAKRPWRSSFTVSLAWWFLDQKLMNEAAEHQLTVLTSSRDEIDLERSGPKLSFDGEDELLDALAETWRKCSQDIHGLSMVNDFEYYHFLQPNQYVDGSKRLTAEELRQAYDPESRFVGLVGAGYPKLLREAAVLRDTGVGFVDLSRVFADVDETVYIDTCCHFNREGVRIIVDQIVDRINRSPVAPDGGSSNPGYNPR